MGSSDWDDLAEAVQNELAEVVTGHGDARANAILELRCVVNRSRDNTRTALEDAAIAVMRQAVDALDLSYDEADRDAIRTLFGLAPGTRRLPAEARYDRIIEIYEQWNHLNALDVDHAHGRKATGRATIRQTRRPQWIALLRDEIMGFEREERRRASLEGVVPSTARGERAEVVVDWATFDTMARHLARSLSAFKPDTVIGIARGGLPLAVRLSHLLGTRALGAISIHKYLAESAFAPAGRAELDSALLPDGPRTRILLVDDIVAIGDTMRTADAHVRANYGTDVAVAYAALFADVDRLRTRWTAPFEGGATFAYASTIDNARSWVTFPWEADGLHHDDVKQG